MTILRQNIITVMPLFIILGLLYCLVSHLLQMKEFNWSVDQEAESIGATIHEFVTNDFDLYFSKTPDGSLAVTDQLQRVIHRLSLQQDVLDIAIYDRDLNLFYSRSGDTVFVDRPLAAEDAPADSLSAGPDLNRSVNSAPQGIAESYNELTGISTDDRPPYLHELDLAEDNPVLTIYSLLYDSFADTINNEETTVTATGATGPDNAFISVRKDASSFAAIHANISRWTVIEFLAYVIAGLMVSLVLSFVLKRSVDELHSKSGDIISGKMGTEQADSRIYEFNELGNTMQMLVNVLGKNVEGYRRRIIENEQMRTPMEIASTFKKLSNPEFNSVCFNRHIRYGYINDKSPGYFVSHLDLSDGMLIVTGYTKEGVNPVETALDSDALCRILIRGMAVSESGNENEISVTEAIQTVRKLFAADDLRLDLIRIQGSGEIIIDHFEGHDPDQTNYSKDHPEAVIVGYFPEVFSNRVNNYRRLLNGEYTEEIFKDIEILSKGFGTGVLVTISPQINRIKYEE